MDNTNRIKRQLAPGEAAAVIEAADPLKLSERDSLRVLVLLKGPPAPNAKLRAAAAAMPSPALPSRRG